MKRNLCLSIGIFSGINAVVLFLGIPWLLEVISPSLFQMLVLAALFAAISGIIAALIASLAFELPFETFSAFLKNATFKKEFPVALPFKSSPEIKRVYEAIRAAVLQTNKEIGRTTSSGDEVPIQSGGKSGTSRQPAGELEAFIAE